MTVFEPGISGVGSYCSTDSATTTPSSYIISEVILATYQSCYNQYERSKIPQRCYSPTIVDCLLMGCT